MFLIFPDLKSHQVFASLGILLVLIAYGWLISDGSWTQWPTTTTDYAQLASSFQHGSLSLEIKPDPALLALPNPYDPGQRHHVTYLLDVSLYNGRYYLYFGPVPALFLLALRFLGLGNIGDQYFAFAFISGMLVFQSLLIVKIWKRFFKNIPAWIIPFCILFCGLFPIPWILTAAQVYDAAIAGGQFFFLGGLYFLITALIRIHFGRTIACRRDFMGARDWMRLTLIVPIGFVMFMVACWAFRTYSRTRRFSTAVRPLIPLTSPLVLGLAALGWYNWARLIRSLKPVSFTSWRDHSFNYIGMFSFPRSIYCQISMTICLCGQKSSGFFLFYKSGVGSGASRFPFISLPRVYYANSLTGILPSTPFVLFAFIPMAFLLLRKKSVENQADQYLFNWLTISLAGSFAFGFAPLVMFFWLAPRYAADFIPSLILLSIVGFWQGYRFTMDKPSLRKLYVAVGMILMAISVIISILLVLSEHAAQFQQFNPALWHDLINFFPRLH